MTRVPTWTELRLDATKLAKLQRECYDSVHDLLDSAIPSLDRKLNTLTNGITQPTKVSCPKPKHQVQNHIVVAGDYEPESDDMDSLEHLKPLPMPLSEYFKANRPKLLSRANQRVMYIKKKSERRKYLSSTRTINYSLNQVRLSSRNSTSSLKRQTLPKNYPAFEYQVRHKLSEQEMKRLTAKTYKRLPEVKKRQKEEDSNRMRVQNYKNRLEYGRKLLENRKHGIINYPLKSSFDDRSITSSQSEYSMTDCGASDTSRVDPYF